jgi:hypothetical protein
LYISEHPTHVKDYDHPTHVVIRVYEPGFSKRKKMKLGQKAEAFIFLSSCLIFSFPFIFSDG